MRCAHRAGWAQRGGEARCHGCGVRRFTSYGALRPPGLAEATPRTFLVGHQAEGGAPREHTPPPPAAGGGGEPNTHPQQPRQTHPH
ncbi:DUF6255 family natural product biosynthesis protein, partial [Streptomyces abikoensis]|uniref:DUF6255 family natural product biosynthesis protein n=1 Tax=Streptomyces abikoensis TaxID=97398 RepID=UPI00369FE5FE